MLSYLFGKVKHPVNIVVDVCVHNRQKVGLTEPDRVGGKLEELPVPEGVLLG